MMVWVDVTEMDIEEGVPGGWNGCPVVLAIDRTCSELTAISRWRWRLRELPRCNYGIMFLMQLPMPALRFIQDFDDPDTRHLCKPFRFKLPMPWVRG